MVCTRCGQNNPGEARFCFACGTPMAAVVETVVSAGVAVRPEPDLTASPAVNTPGPRLCPGCRLLVGGTTTRCECGYDFHVGARVIGDVANTALGGAYYPCTIAKLLVLYPATLGVYGVYWFYQHWAREQLRTRAAISPLARAWFCPIWCYDLARRMNETAATAGVPASYPPAMAAAAFVLLNICFRLPDPFWVLGFLAPMALVPLQSTANAINATLQPTPVPPRGFTVPEAVIATAGITLLTLGILGSLMPQG